MFYNHDEHHEPHERGHGWGRQARRGDMRLIILHVLRDRPMHGYEVIRHLEEKSHGLWRPSPGSIYPTLQLLEDEGLIESQEVDGKRVYQTTKAGQDESGHDPHEHWRKFEDAGSLHELHNTGFDIMRQLKSIVRSRDEQNMAAALKILKQAHDELSNIIKP